MAVTKPVSVPSWAIQDKTDPVSGENNVDTPTAEQVNFGYSSPKQYPSRQMWNWLGRVVSNWFAWLDQQETTHTVEIAALDSELAATTAKAEQAAAKAETNRLKNVEQDAELETIDGRVSAVEAFVGTPVATIVPYYGNSTTLAAASDSWLICDGSVFDSVKYPALLVHFSAAGKADPTKLPKMAGLVPIGVGGYTDASGSYNYALNEAPVGITKSILDVENLPEHVHGTYDVNLNQTVRSDTGGTQSPVQNLVNDNVTEGVKVPAGKTLGTPHENRQPSIALNYIIKAK